MASVLIKKTNSVIVIKKTTPSSFKKDVVQEVKVNLSST